MRRRHILCNIIRAALLCGLAGPVIGCFYVGMLSGRPLLVVAVDIAGLPVYAYALITAGPFGFVMEPSVDSSLPGSFEWGEHDWDSFAGLPSTERSALSSRLYSR